MYFNSHSVRSGHRYDTDFLIRTIYSPSERYRASVQCITLFSDCPIELINFVCAVHKAWRHQLYNAVQFEDSHILLDGVSIAGTCRCYASTHPADRLLDTIH